MPDTTIAARIPADLDEQLTTRTRAQGRDRDAPIAAALHACVAYAATFVAAVEEGVRAGAAGDVVPHAVVVAEVAARRRRWPARRG